MYTLSLHDALPISPGCSSGPRSAGTRSRCTLPPAPGPALRAPATCSSSLVAPCRRIHCVCWPPYRLIVPQDRKSTRLNSSHTVISYAVFCLKNKKTDVLHLHREAVQFIGGIDVRHESGSGRRRLLASRTPRRPVVERPRAQPLWQAALVAYI